MLRPTHWAKMLDNRGQVDTFILDFEKAFVTPLKCKLFSYGLWKDIEMDRFFFYASDNNELL